MVIIICPKYSKKICKKTVKCVTLHQNSVGKCVNVHQNSVGKCDNNTTTS